MTLEKFIALYFPFKTKAYCTIQVARVTSSVTALLLALYDVQYVVVYEIRYYDNGVAYCGTPYPQYLAVLDKIDSVLYSFGIFTIMFVVNFAVILKFNACKM